MADIVYINKKWDSCAFVRRACPVLTEPLFQFPFRLTASELNATSNVDLEDTDSSQFSMELGDFCEEARSPIGWGGLGPPDQG